MMYIDDVDPKYDVVEFFTNKWSEYLEQESAECRAYNSKHRLDYYNQWFNTFDSSNIPEILRPSLLKALEWLNENKDHIYSPDVDEFRLKFQDQ